MLCLHSWIPLIFQSPLKGSRATLCAANAPRWRAGGASGTGCRLEEHGAPRPLLRITCTRSTLESTLTTIVTAFCKSLLYQSCTAVPAETTPCLTMPHRARLQDTAEPASTPSKSAAQSRMEASRLATKYWCSSSAVPKARITAPTRRAVRRGRLSHQPLLQHSPRDRVKSA